MNEREIKEESERALQAATVAKEMGWPDVAEAYEHVALLLMQQRLAIIRARRRGAA